MRNAIQMISSLMFGPSGVGAASGELPPQLRQRWKVMFSAEQKHLGIAKGDHVQIRPEFFGKDEFELDLEVQDSAAKILCKPTLLLVNNFSGDKDENDLSGDQARDLLRESGLEFLSRFHTLVSKRRIKSYVYGLAYIAHKNSSLASSHAIMSCSFTREGGPREYLLGVVSLEGGRAPGFHNGVVHGDP